MVHNSPDLSNLQKAVSAIEAGGHTLQVRRSDLGFVATLRSSKLELLLVGGNGVKVVSLDLADPTNERFLSELSRGASSLDLHSIEEAIIRSACLVKAMTSPILNRIRQANAAQVSLSLEINDKGEAKNLTAMVAGQDEIVENDVNTMKAISNEIVKNVGHQPLGLEFRANRLSYYGMNEEYRPAFREWLMAPITPQRVDARDDEEEERKEPRSDLASSLQEILNQESTEWKRLLWQLSAGNLNTFRALDLSDLKASDEKKALLQGLVDDMGAESPPWAQERASASMDRGVDDDES